MQNTLTDLNNHLFEALETVDDDMTSEEFERFSKKCKIKIDLANSIISNAKIQFEASKFFTENGLTNKDKEYVPQMLEIKTVND